MHSQKNCEAGLHIHDSELTNASTKNKTTQLRARAMLSLLKRRHHATIIVCEQRSSNRKGWAEVLEFRPPRERKEKDATV